MDSLKCAISDHFFSMSYSIDVSKPISYVLVHDRGQHLQAKGSAECRRLLKCATH